MVYDFGRRLRFAPESAQHNWGGVVFEFLDEMRRGTKVFLVRRWLSLAAQVIGIIAAAIWSQSAGLTALLIVLAVIVDINAIYHYRRTPRRW